MWISVEGAAFLGSVLPVAVLVIVVESRAAAMTPRRAMSFGWLKVYSRGSAVVGMFTSALAIPAIVFCFAIVNSGNGNSGTYAWYIGLTTPLVAVSAGAALLDLAELLIKAEKVGAAAFTDKSDAKASTEAASTPRRPTKKTRKRSR